MIEKTMFEKYWSMRSFPGDEKSLFQSEHAVNKHGDVWK